MLTHHDAYSCFQQVRATSHVGLSGDLYRAAVRYARLRADWRLADPDARKEMDESRTRAHEAFIDACNILSRRMASASESTGWRRTLGDDRKTIGDFACWLHAFLALEAR